jgi:hypothetical protein
MAIKSGCLLRLLLSKVGSMASVLVFSLAVFGLKGALSIQVSVNNE